MVYKTDGTTYPFTFNAEGLNQTFHLSCLFTNHIYKLVNLGVQQYVNNEETQSNFCQIIYFCPTLIYFFLLKKQITFLEHFYEYYGSVWLCDWLIYWPWVYTQWCICCPHVSAGLLAGAHSRLLCHQSCHTQTHVHNHTQITFTQKLKILLDVLINSSLPLPSQCKGIYNISTQASQC